MVREAPGVEYGGDGARVCRAPLKGELQERRSKVKYKTGYVERKKANNPK